MFFWGQLNCPARLERPAYEVMTEAVYYAGGLGLILLGLMRLEILASVSVSKVALRNM